MGLGPVEREEAFRSPFSRIAGQTRSPSKENERPKKRRSRIACNSCRASWKARTKCIAPAENASRLVCTRCAASGFECTFPISHRGRKKGSKNLRTLARLEARTITDEQLHRADSSDGQSSPSTNGYFPVTAGFAPTFQSSHPGAFAATELRAPNFFNIDEASGSRSKRHLPGDVTPLDPHNLMEPYQRISDDRNQPLTRKQINELEHQFPVGHDRDETSLTGFDGPREAYKHPMVSLASMANRAWDTDSPPDRRTLDNPSLSSVFNIPLPASDLALMNRWTTASLHKAVQGQTSFFEHGLHGSKRDVAQGLDAIQRNLVTHERAVELCKSYFKHVHPQWAMLSEDLHTIEFMQSRSALLLSMVLAIGSTALATLGDGHPELVSEALTLHAHVEKLHLVVFATGARSIDIIQAMILSCRFGLTAKSRLAEQRWLRSATIPRMAFEIGLHLDLRHDSKQFGSGAVTADALHLNDLQTRVFMIVNESRFSAFTGRDPLDMSQFELSDAEMEELQRDAPKSRSAPASYGLYRLQRDVQLRLKVAESSSSKGCALSEELEWIQAFIRKWERDWCTGVRSRLQWHLLHESRSSQLLLTAQIAKRRCNTAHLLQDQQMLLGLATMILESALETPGATHMSHRASIFPFAASLVLKLGSTRDLVLRVGLHMSGDPTTPHIPTFVRDAGHALLAMVCAAPQSAPTLTAGELSDRANAMRPSQPSNDVFDFAQLWAVPGVNTAQQDSALPEGPGFDIEETLAMLGNGIMTSPTNQDMVGGPSGQATMPLSQYFGDSLQTFLGLEDMPVAQETTVNMAPSAAAPRPNSATVPNGETYPLIPLESLNGQESAVDISTDFSPSTSIESLGLPASLPLRDTSKEAILEAIATLAGIVSKMH